MKAFLLLINIIFLATVLFAVWKKTVYLKPVFLPAAVVKVAMGILLGMVYAFYYEVGDTFLFVQDGNVIAQLATHNFSDYLSFIFQRGSGNMLAGELIFSEPRAIFLSKVCSVFSIITGGNYWMISVYFSLLSFFGCWYFVKQVHRFIPSITWPAVVSFLFFPSVVFWTSGVIKETLAIGAIAFIAALLVKFWFSAPIHWSSWIGALVAAWLSWNLKYYFAAIFFSVVITTGIYKVFLLGTKQSFARQCMSWVIIFSALLAVSSLLHPNFSPSRFFKVVTDNYHAFQILSDEGDAVQFAWMDEANAKVLYNTPNALLTGLYRPFLWEAADNVFQIWIGLENLVVALLTIVGLFSLVRPTENQHRILILGVIVYVSILCVLLTLSTPNFGTLSRYRTSYFPFFILLLLSSPKVNAFLQRSFNRLVLYKP